MHVLINRAHMAGKHEIALIFFDQILDLCPVLPWELRELTRKNHIESEAKRIARRKGFSWEWYE